ncbi:MAG: hypothetical protein ABW096_01150 [Candidatus Thiodiazotropha sp.]
MPPGQGGRQQQQQTAAAQGPAHGAEGIRVETGKGVVDQQSALPAQVSQCLIVAQDPYTICGRLPYPKVIPEVETVQRRGGLTRTPGRLSGDYQEGPVSLPSCLAMEPVKQIWKY